ncbi:GNAT family N-acetyltransferase [Streptomyces sp. NPDC090106]|uniref:GNAT family N-acetyltransferase n=1 Tax=Streptomyces sp. NPDC090106 TaxID=3365946 RepID=UPI00380A20AB
MYQTDARHGLTTLTDQDEIAACLPDVTQLYLDASADLTAFAGLLPPSAFFDLYRGDLRSPGARLVKAERGGHVVGFGFGTLLPADTTWWRSLVSSAMPDSFTHEDGRRTFVIRAVVVRPACQGLGYGTALHDALLRGTGTERSTLMVSPRIRPALALCEALGYLFVGAARPEGTDATYLSMVRSEGSTAFHRRPRRR